MKVRVLFVALALALTATAVPAFGDHVNEPTSPITEYTMEVYNYPNFATALSKCNGTEVLKSISGAVALDARFETFARAATFPSEHWNETLTLFVVTRLGQTNESEKYQWRVTWNHSNIKPHARGGIGGNGPESSQNSQRLTGFAAGTILRIRGEMTTLESGQQLTAQCTFKAG